jgi:chromosome segregation ATPase
MARTSNITFGQVAAIADAMKAAGNRPTARAVRERIGSGSMGTIHNLLKQWSGKEQADEEGDAAELPSHIQSALMDFIGTEIATACEPLNEELQAAKEAADAIAEDNERLNSAWEMQDLDLSRCREERAAAMAQLNLTRDELMKARMIRDDLQSQVMQLQRDLDRANRQTEMLANMQPDLVQAQNALASSEADRIKSEKDAAVLLAQLVAETKHSADLAERLNAAEKRNASQEAELKTAQATAQRATAELGSVARELADAKAQTVKSVKSSPKKAAPKKPTNQELAV